MHNFNELYEMCKNPTVTTSNLSILILKNMKIFF